MTKSHAKRPRAANGAALTFAKWHRRLGIASALVVVWLAFTGILLGHTDDFGLDERHVGTNWLLDWYGIPLPAVAAAYRAGDNWIAQVGERIYFNHGALDGEYGELRGALPLADEVVVAAGAQLVVLTRAGGLLEVLGEAHGVPEEARAVGVQHGQLIARTAQGDYIAGEDLLAWRRAKATNALWSQPAALPAALRAHITEDYRGRLLTLERLLQDLHSGRLFGRFGVWFMDLAALGFLVLAATGLWTWLLRGNRAGKTKGVK